MLLVIAAGYYATVVEWEMYARKVVKNNKKSGAGESGR
jgi:hypothetical protein